MPKYRFDWSSLPTPLLRRLAVELQLSGDPVVALRKAYGARPDESFVQAAWPVILDSWVARAPTVRRSLANGLRARGLGDADVKLTNARTELAYLRSCRNSPRLREMVLAHLITTGEEPPVPKHATSHAGAAKAAALAVPGNWRSFSTSLTESLANLEVDQYLIVNLRRRPEFYVQFAQGGANGLRAETVSNAFLPDDEHLDDHALGELLALGWEPPQPGSRGGGPNHHRDWATPVPYSDVSSLAVATLTKVLGASRPGMLTYTAFAKGGTQIIIPTLGIRREPVNKDERKPSEPSPVHSAEELLEQVKRVMGPLLGTDEIVVDNDGDIPVRSGSVMVYVRVLKNTPVVRVFSPVIYDLGAPPDILDAVNDINNEVLFARAVWDGNGVVLSSDVLGAPLVGAQLTRSYEAVAQLADEYALKLQERYGGRLAFGPALPAKTLEHLPGYL
ncbi:MAG TPA: YbjN domain-containing protein [Acidimicrobiales bacterium]|nr:YbjN domain-containing protein [Acidimicrobiales bacterium]